MKISGYEGGVLTPERIEQYVNPETKDVSLETKDKVTDYLETPLEVLNLKDTLSNNINSAYKQISYRVEDDNGVNILKVKNNEKRTIELFKENFDNNISIPINRAFNNGTIEIIVNKLKNISEERTLSPEEKDNLDFFENIDDFHKELSIKYNELLEIDFSQIRNNLGEKDNGLGKKASLQFEELRDFIEDIGRRYDSVEKRINNEIIIKGKRENEIDNSKMISFLAKIKEYASIVLK